MKKLLTPTVLTAAAIASTAFLASALPSYAEDAGGGKRPERSVNIAEMEARSVERFESADQNSDGLVSEAEFTSAMQNRAASGERGGDKPRHHKKGHGKRFSEKGRMANLSDEERASVRKERGDQAFAAMDSDSDGVISAEEFAKRDEVRKELRSSSRFQSLDSNGDGNLTLDETQSKLARLREMDTDSDGVVTRPEMRAYRSKTDSAQNPS